jgi:hypothetical protein
MKPIVLFLLLTFNVSGFAQDKVEIDKNELPHLKLQNQNNADLVVVFDNYNSKFYQEVVNQLNQLEGIIMKGYCESLNCFYFEIDTLIFKSTNDAFEILESKTKKFLPVFKEGTTSLMVVSNCQRI